MVKLLIFILQRLLAVEKECKKNKAQIAMLQGYIKGVNDKY